MLVNCVSPLDCLCVHYLGSSIHPAFCLSETCLPHVYSDDRLTHLAVPDMDLSLWAMLQIFLLDMEGGHRGHASGQKWHEDLQWARRLDEGWNLAAVKQVSCPNCQATTTSYFPFKAHTDTQTLHQS